MIPNIEQFVQCETVIQGYNTPHLTHVCTDLPDGHIAEFGVAGGTTLNWIARQVPDRAVYGFDSWQGLPEPWIKGGDVSPRGRFRCPVPKVFDNVRLVSGLFADTIPLWKIETTGTMALIHIDCDLYSSTRDVLFGLNDRIVAGTRIVFDELYYFGKPSDYPNWMEHEWRALCEWVSECERAYRVFSRASSWPCCIEVL